MPDPPFTVTLAAARSGDEGAWQRLFRSLAPALLGYLRSLGTAEPEDVLSETFLQLARDIERFSGDWAGFRAWAYSIAHHRMVDAARNRARRPVDPVGDVPVPGAAAAPDASEAVIAKVGAEEIRDVLNALSADQREVLLLRSLGELKLSEVAEVMGRREGAIKQLQRRGVAAVQRELKRRGVTL